MKKKCLFLGLATSSICILSILFVNTKGFIGNADFIAKSYEKPYSIVFNDNTNKIGTEKNDDIPHSGSGVAMTGLGNPITFDYNSFYNPTDKWQTIAAGGYLTNTQPINGMTSITFTRSDISHNIRVYWSSSTTFREDQSVLFDSSMPLTVSTDFDDYFPNYVKIIAVNETSIDYGVIEFSCSNHYHSLTLNFYNQINGSVNGSGNYAIGESVTITATPTDGHWFVAWHDDTSGIVSELMTFTFIMPDYDLSYSAEFMLIQKGDIIKSGTYPQTKVTDSVLIDQLNTAAGVLPTSDNSQTWTSYQYYISGSNATNFMWYKDVTRGSDRYRGVYFTSYRPFTTNYSSSTDNSRQDDNGYLINTRYWFKYELIAWDVLSTDETDGPLFMADKILDSRDYYHSNSSRTIGGQTVYASNYKESDVRAWLNNDFFDKVFLPVEKNLIKTTNVDNSVYSAGDGPNQYVTNNTTDKLFLLSYREVINADYGFYPNSNGHTSRERSSTDYGKAMGVEVNTSRGSSNWLLRSPLEYSYNGGAVCFVNDVGTAALPVGVENTNIGILPAFRINQ